MKLIIFLLCTGLFLCLQAKDSKGEDVKTEVVQAHDDIPKDFADVGQETRRASSGMKIVFKNALKTIKGLNCIIKEVLDIESATRSFKNQVEACNEKVAIKVKKIINACNEILVTCQETFKINEQICGNTISDEEKNIGVIENAVPSKNCSSNISKKLQTLKKQLRKGVKLINQAEKSHQTSECENAAISNMKTYFTEFPNVMKTCPAPIGN